MKKDFKYFIVLAIALAIFYYLKEYIDLKNYNFILDIYIFSIGYLSFLYGKSDK
jgi:hypothetical protein